VRTLIFAGVSIALSLLVSPACSKDESNLAKLAEKQDQPTEPEGTPKAVEPEPSKPTDAGSGTSSSPSEPGRWPLDANGLPIPPQDGAAELLTPGADADRVTLRLALSEGAHYRITTLGMLKLPLIEKPTGFAREEDVELSDCKGEAGTRTCLLTHHYRNFEAEPPTGSGLEADERLVAGLVTSHRVDASGLRITDTAVQGEAAPPILEQMAQVHQLYCIRLPSEPVGIGATWRDVCRMRQGGMLVTRELTWRLAKLERTDDGTRAELEYAGRARRFDGKGNLVDGEVKGGLFLWVDAGEPHLMRERIAFELDAAKGVGTSTDLRYQFTKVGEDGEQLLRTDGKPFDQPPQVLNDPRHVPAGATRDDELPK
jgi:hypothetical protein